METTTEEAKNRPISAAEFLVARAKVSGFLKELAAAICFIEQHEHNHPGMTSAMREALDEMFDDNIFLPGFTAGGFVCEGLDVSGLFTEAELAPYLDANNNA